MEVCSPVLPSTRNLFPRFFSFVIACIRTVFRVWESTPRERLYARVRGTLFSRSGRELMVEEFREGVDVSKQFFLARRGLGEGGSGRRARVAGTDGHSSRGKKGGRLWAGQGGRRSGERQAKEEATCACVRQSFKWGFGVWWGAISVGDVDVKPPRKNLALLYR